MKESSIEIVSQPPVADAWDERLKTASLAVSMPSKSPPLKGIPAKDRSRLLIVYLYSNFTIGLQNLEFFGERGLNGAADFIFVFNENVTEDIIDLIPEEPNIKIKRRENTCFDLGAIGEVLSEGDLWKKYTRFITMNASVRGPFLPAYSSSACWTDLFLNKITDKLVATTSNCLPRPHAQSMLFATDHIGMSILMNKTLAFSVGVAENYGSVDDPTGFTPCYPTLNKAVHGEMGFTNLIRSQGYEVDAIMISFQAATPETYCAVAGNPPDALYTGRYFGASVHPYELIFIKANRKIEPKLLENMTKWHLSMNTSSWDTCVAKNK